MANQYARPSGLFGRLFIAPLLNRTNAGSNAAVFQSLELDPESRVLEIGFGGGDLLFRIASAVTDETTHGLELSEDMIDRARSKSKSRNLAGRISFQSGVVISLPYDNCQFNRVCSVNTVYFWPDLTRAFTEIARVVEPGALLVLGFGSHQAMRDAGYDVDAFHLHPPDAISQALLESGFSKERLETINRNKRGAFHISTSVLRS